MNAVFFLRLLLLGLGLGGAVGRRRFLGRDCTSRFGFFFESSILKPSYFFRSLPPAVERTSLFGWANPFVRGLVGLYIPRLLLKTLALTAPPPPLFLQRFPGRNLLYRQSRP